MLNNKTAKLILENGMILSGESIGSIGETIGEVCFNTSITGYQEIITDPSYFGQIINMTYPHIGNYGINIEDSESEKIQISGLIVRELNKIPSNYRSSLSLNKYLKKQDIVGIQGIDTRMLTKIIRNEGSMNAIICSKGTNNTILINKLNSYPSMVGLDLTKKVTTKNKYSLNNYNKEHYNIAVIDYGIKKNILRILESYRCNITVFPATVTSNEILNFNPDGIFLSNGPGDPSAVKYGIKTVKNLIGKKPIFGICLGHQLLCLALGAKTYKLKFGHRGSNHPVKNLKTGCIEITSQNHGFSVDCNTIPKNIKITHISLNDKSIEGIMSKKLRLFSVQYHPESSPGPHDSKYLFNDFIKMMEKKVFA